VFKKDPTDPTILHIFARHLKKPNQAIWAWFNGQFVWSTQHKRFEGAADSLGLYWYWIKEGTVVMIVSCFDL